MATSNGRELDANGYEIQTQGTLIAGEDLTNNGAATLIGDAWFDDIQLVPTTAVARTVAT